MYSLTSKLRFRKNSDEKQLLRTEKLNKTKISNKDGKLIMQTEKHIIHNLPFRYTVFKAF